MADAKSQTPSNADVRPDSLETLFRSPIAKIYFNGFGMAMGTADVTLVLQVTNMPIAILNTPYEVAKALAESLTKAIQEVEQKAKIKFHSLSEIAESLESSKTLAKPGSK